MMSALPPPTQAAGREARSARFIRLVGSEAGECSRAPDPVTRADWRATGEKQKKGAAKVPLASEKRVGDVEGAEEDAASLVSATSTTRMLSWAAEMD